MAAQQMKTHYKNRPLPPLENCQYEEIDDQRTDQGPVNGGNTSEYEPGYLLPIRRTGPAPTTSSVPAVNAQDTGHVYLTVVPDPEESSREGRQGSITVTDCHSKNNGDHTDRAAGPCKLTKRELCFAAALTVVCVTLVVTAAVLGTAVTHNGPGSGEASKCQSAPCQNGGNCTEHITGFSCKCPNGFKGSLCQEDVNVCESNPCPSGAMCQKNGNGYGCYKCAEHYYGAACSNRILVQDPIDCNSYYDQGVRIDGVYTITPAGSTPFDVYCSLSGDSASTIIQHRFDGSVNFNRTWADYKAGFGSLSGEHWLGNDQIHLLTNQARYTLWVDGVTLEGKHVWADYDRFSILNETSLYRLSIGKQTEADPDTAASIPLGGFIENFNRGQAFSTWDRDNNIHSDGNCGLLFSGGWWYQDTQRCSDTLLNAPHGTAPCSPTTCIKWHNHLSTYVTETTMEVTRTSVRN